MTSMASATIASMLSMAMTTRSMVTPRSAFLGRGWVRRRIILVPLGLSSLALISHERVDRDLAGPGIALPRNQEPDDPAELPLIGILQDDTGTDHLDLRSADEGV